MLDVCSLTPQNEPLFLLHPLPQTFFHSPLQHPVLQPQGLFTYSAAVPPRTLQSCGPSSCSHGRTGIKIAALHRGGFLLTPWLHLCRVLPTNPVRTCRETWSPIYCICHEARALDSFDRQEFQNPDSQSVQTIVLGIPGATNTLG